MNKEDIDNLQAGLQTDKLVAEHLFGWHKFETSNTKFTALMIPSCGVCHRPEGYAYYQINQIHHIGVQQIPPYSSLRYAAYSIVDLMLKEGWSLSELSSDNGTYWSVVWELLPRSNEIAIVANAESDCLAICKAGLKWKFGITI